MPDLPVISLFSGALGLDLGLEQAGFSVRVALECDKHAAATIRKNRPDLPLIEAKIEDVSTEQILDAAGLRVGEAAVVIGGPSCQSFSTAGLRGSLQDQRGNMFHEFLRVVEEARPRFFCMENVKGILSAAVQHRPLRERGPGYPKLKPEEELGSALKLIVGELARTGYFTVFDVLNAADYGVPQTRERVIFLGSRFGEPVEIPLRTHAADGSNGIKPWITLGQALRGLRQDPTPIYTKLSPKNQRFMKLVPAGGNWRSLPENLHEEALGGAYHSWGGRTGFYRRLSWDAPCPALTTRPDSKATMFCHPSELRPLSVEEYRRIQQFPRDWEFAGSTAKQYVQVGNAVPAGLGRAIGGAIRRTMGKRRRVRGGVVVCADQALLKRLSNRPRTVLNPPRMRKNKGIEAASDWLDSEDRNRTGILDLVVVSAEVEPLPAAGGPNADRGRRARATRTLALLHEAYGSPRPGGRDPLDALVFAILTQLTKGTLLQENFDCLKAGIPTWDEFTRLHLREVRSLITAAGLNGKIARQLRETLRAISARFGSVSLEGLRGMEDEEADRVLQSFPGIGSTTADRIMLYALHRDVLPTDASVRRVAERIGLIDPGLPPTRARATLEAVVKPADRYAFHSNVMAHGRVRCKATRMSCSDCPLRRLCPVSQERSPEITKTQAK